MTEHKIKRTVCWFSCGAASAVATKIAIDDFGNAPLTVASIYLKREHSDNERFLNECSKWFARPVHQLRSRDYDADPHVVFLRTGWLVGPKGAACTRILKRDVRTEFERPTDRQIFGFTYEEEARYEKFLDANNHLTVDAPLIRHKLTKKDCLGLLQSAGIEIPVMYRMGYNNNNCIGCVKGGAGYWNKIRVDFPEVFEQMAQIEERLGPGRTTQAKAYINGVRRRVSLRELPVDAGWNEKEEDIECGAVCQMAADKFADPCEDL